MVLLIDTSSALAAVVLVGDGEPRQLVRPSGRGLDVAGMVAVVAQPERVERIGVATGPGSFTGLRAGVAYAVGLALARGLPLHALPSLPLQAARAGIPVTAVTEAGRGRLYFLPPGGVASLGEPDDLPASLAVVGWLREATVRAVEASGRQLLPETDLRPFWAAATDLLRAAPEAAYGRVGLEYLGSPGSV